jgi:hypothetical protein
MAACRDAERSKSGFHTGFPDFNAEVLIAVADSARCLYAAGEVPNLDLMETVIRDCLILNGLRASSFGPTGNEDEYLRYAERKGRNIVILLTASEPLLVDLLDSLTALSLQLHRVAHAAPESGELRKRIHDLRQKTDKLIEAVKLGAEVARNPTNTYNEYEGIYDPKIRITLQEIVGMLLTIEEHYKVAAPNRLTRSESDFHRD